MNDAGRIGFVIRDDYDNTVQYDFLDVVYYHGNSYVAKKLTLGNIPNENNEYWHILAAGGVRVKGDAEAEYRTGEVNLTPENIGLGNVNNTSDADKPISTAQQEEFNKKVNKTDVMPTVLKNTGDTSGYVKIMDISTIANWGGTPITFKVLNQVDYAYLVTVSPTGGSVTSTTIEALDVLKLSSVSALAAEGDFVAINKGSGKMSVWINVRNGYEFTVSDVDYDKNFYAVTINLTANNIPSSLEELSATGTVVHDNLMNKEYSVMQGATTSAAGKAGLVPAPGTGNPDAVLKSNGTWAEGTYRSLGEVSVSGWYRIFSKTTSAVAGSGDAFMLTVSRGYSNNPPENFRVVCSTKYNSVQWCWHTLSSMVTVTSSKFVDKVRAAKKGNLLYIEVHYTANVGNTISFEMSYNSGFGTFLQEPRQALNFEPATEDETVISEYTIPDKDDFETSKSLTRFTEIPEGADLKSKKYLVPGNYSCNDTTKCQTLVNCPVSKSFTLDVSYANGYDHYIKQTFTLYNGERITSRTYDKSGKWQNDMHYYASPGAPPSNKLWGTDANGVPGWISPPLGNVFVSEYRHDSNGYVKFATITVQNNGWRSQPLVMDFLRYAGFYTKLIYSATSGLLRTDANLIANGLTTENIEIMCVDTSSAVVDLYVHVSNGSSISTAVVVNPYDVYRVEFHDFTNVEAITKEAVQALGIRVYSSRRASVA